MDSFNDSIEALFFQQTIQSEIDHIETIALSDFGLYVDYTLLDHLNIFPIHEAMIKRSYRNIRFLNKSSCNADECLALCLRAINLLISSKEKDFIAGNDAVFPYLFIPYESGFSSLPHWIIICEAYFNHANTLNMTERVVSHLQYKFETNLFYQLITPLNVELTQSIENKNLSDNIDLDAIELLLELIDSNLNLDLAKSHELIIDLKTALFQPKAASFKSAGRFSTL